MPRLQGRSIFGCKTLFIASGGSEDLILFRDAAALSPGDRIVYRGSAGYAVGTVLQLREDLLQLEGAAEPVSRTAVLGRCQMRLPGAGVLYAFLGTVPGYLTGIFLPILLLIGLQAFCIVSAFRQYRREQLSKMEAMWMQTQAQQTETSRLLEELLSLRKEFFRESGQRALPPEPPETLEAILQEFREEPEIQAG